MDALKLAFETVIVGLFALPWLWVMIDLVNPGLFSSPGVRRLGAYVPTELRPSAIGLTLFAVVYLLGSMITPVAYEFLNDPDMLGKFLPTEEKIQVWDYKNLDVQWIPGLVHADSDEVYRKKVGPEFQHDESTLLLQGPQACERVDRLHEQLTVLRGATFSAFALSALCLMGWCGRRLGNPSPAVGIFSWQAVRTSIGSVLSIATIIWAAYGIYLDLHHPEVGDMPIAELVFLVLGGLGAYVLIWGTRSRLQFHGPAFLVALCFAILCYAGYGSVATSYDHAVFSTYLALPASTNENSSRAMARFEMPIIGEE
jgi:hypothetical protein